MNKDLIMEILGNKIDEVFAECHSVNGIKNGDILPMDVLKLENLKKEVVDLICFIINYQMGKRI